MGNIIAQICENFISEVTNFFGENKIKSIEEMEINLKQKADRFVMEMMQVYLEGLDQAIIEDKAGRRRKGIVIERKEDKREIYTRFGQLKFKRTYYYDKKRDEYVYLLDQAVGLEGYERISYTVGADLIEHAAEASYGESSRHVCNGEISRQTVMNKLRSIKELKIELPKERRKVKVIHIEADEDHVSLQDGTTTIVPLISIHEGVEREGKRGQCKNIHHISSYGKVPEELWLEAVEWIYSAYDVEGIERIYIHGDGASWIKEGLKWVPKAKIVLDRYHLNQAVMEVTGKQHGLRKEIYSAIRDGDKEKFKQVIKELYRYAISDNERERIDNFRRYVIKNWEGITIYGEEGCEGSCTEGHVSHVLSSRLSSRPMGWSREGLKAMAELRAYYCNGGRIEVKHLKSAEECYRPSKKVLEKAAKAFRNFGMEKLNNIALLRYSKVTPLFRCLKTIQYSGYVL